jgi:asparagine synthase (glutamine-hydrolysing)
MCGICGFWSRDRLPWSELDLTRMVETLSHRGPDDQGTYFGERAGIAARRLAIMDPGAGHQPMTDESSEILAVQNGEIYNFRQLREELEGKGHRFHTCCDTEILPHLWEEDAEELPKRLSGMFGVAILDTRHNRLLLARDPIGIKPLYVWRTGNHLAFSSEVKALLQLPDCPRKPDPHAVAAFMKYLYVPASLSMLQGIEQLGPGHLLLADERGVRTTRYHDWRSTIEPWSPDRPEKLLDLLRTAVRKQLMADVPLGAFLSGGLDSASVVALMGRAGGERVRTFTVGFRESGYSELREARHVADALGTDHHEFMAEARAASILPKLTWHMDQPTGDPSAIPVYWLAKLAREHVTVALSGDGGDELLAGYKRYRKDLLMREYARLPRWLGKGIGRLGPRGSKLRRLSERAYQEPWERCHGWVQICRDELVESLYATDWLERLPPEDEENTYQFLYRCAPGVSSVRKMQWTDLKTWLPGGMLLKVDRATMAHGLEVRVPFLDPDVVTFCLSLPPGEVANAFWGKLPLRNATQELLPRSIRWRPKHAFDVPISSWIRGDLREMTCDLLQDGRLHGRGMFRQDAADALLRQHLSRDADHGHILWALLTYEIWHRQCIEKEEP